MVPITWENSISGVLTVQYPRQKYSGISATHIQWNLRYSCTVESPLLMYSGISATHVQWNLRYSCTVESPNKGHFGTVILSFVRRLSLIGKSKMYWNYREKYFRTTSCVLCRGIVLNSECPLSEIPLYWSYTYSSWTYTSISLPFSGTKHSLWSALHFRHCKNSHNNASKHTRLVRYRKWFIRP